MRDILGLLGIAIAFFMVIYLSYKGMNLVYVIVAACFVVIVTNEVCSECTRDSADMVRYKKILSEVNRRLAQKADWVTEVVYGIPVEVKR